MWDGKQNKQNAFEVPHFVTEIATGHIGKVISIQSMHYYNESSEFGNVTTQVRQNVLKQRTEKLFTLFYRYALWMKMEQ